MTGGRRRPPLSQVLAGLVVAVLALVALPAPVAGQDDEPEPAPPVVVRQRTFVGTGDTFEVQLDPASVPADGSVELVLRGRILSRSELELSAEGSGLRSAVYGPVGQAVATLPTAPDGSLRLAISFDPEVPGSLSLRSAGVYPLEIRARSAEGEVVGSLVTHLVREPDEADESPPLAVAVLARTLQEPTLGTDGERTVDQVALADTAAWLAAIAAAEVPVGLALSPDALIGVAERAEADEGTAAAEVLEQLRAIAGSGALLTAPYAPTTPDALVEADLTEELARHLAAGAGTFGDLLGARPDLTWVATDDLSPEGVAALVAEGVEHVVVTEDQVEPLRSGLLSLSLAQPFLVGESSAVLDALALDERVVSHIGSDLSPALEANRLLSELAMLWFEQPGIARAAVIPFTEGEVRPEVVAAVLEALADTDVLEATTPDAAFAAAEPLRQPGGGRVDRALEPEDPEGIAGPVRRGLGDGRSQLAGLAALLGPTDPSAAPPAPDAEAARQRVATAEAHLLLATSTALSRDQQAAHLGAVGADALALVGAISAPEHETVTLTAREGRVPMTIRNDGDVPLHVVVHLSSTKLEFPEGSSTPLVLEPGSTRLDVAVRTRTSGSIPLEATITSPDGTLVLAELDYSIRSTAVAGMGIVLSAGAALFLLVWWARHWHRTRRSTKLVEAKHLSHPSSRQSPGPKPDDG